MPRAFPRASLLPTPQRAGTPRTWAPRRLPSLALTEPAMRQGAFLSIRDLCDALTKACRGDRQGMSKCRFLASPCQQPARPREAFTGYGHASETTCDLPILATDGEQSQSGRRTPHVQAPVPIPTSLRHGHAGIPRRQASVQARDDSLPAGRLVAEAGAPTTYRLPPSAKRTERHCWLQQVAYVYSGLWNNDKVILLPIVRILA